MALHQTSSLRVSDGSSPLWNGETCASDGSRANPAGHRVSDGCCANDGTHGSALDFDYCCFVAFLRHGLQPLGQLVRLDLLDDCLAGHDNLGWHRTALGLGVCMAVSTASLRMPRFLVAPEPACLHLHARLRWDNRSHLERIWKPDSLIYSLSGCRET